ncbi:uncharacterized protein LOC142629018 [Castanea sativa]|uniref:uncharacterized protein LOC142629018 n=1 Tax=Castanea sativa TaxID=21020 RepID=UPI003F650EDD
MEVYVDDMLVKSKEELAHLDNLSETFATLRQYQMKLNPSKCAFRVASRKFLGFMVFQRGIEANSEKVQAILDMTSPKTVKEVQKLTGRIAALNTFVSKAMDKCLPFFKILKKAFIWTDKCEAAFQEFKRYLSNPPLLSPSKKGENLYLYLAVSATAIPRSENMLANEIVKQASSEEGSTSSIDFKVEVQKHPNIEEVPTFVIQSTNNWMTPIISFLQDRHLPQDAEEARKVRKKVTRFTILNDTLYKRGFSMPYLKCINEEEAKYILEEIPSRGLWRPRRPQSLGKQSYPNRLLLAYYAGRRKEARQEVRQVPEIRECPTPSSGDTDDDSLPLSHLHNRELISTTARTPTGETPFKLTYGTEAIIPVKMGISNIKRETFHEESNDNQLKINLDCLDDTRDEAFNGLTKYQQKMVEYHNKRVKLKRLDIGDLVLCKVTSATKDLAQGKLGPTWEGPYQVVHYSRQGSYHLETLDGQKLPRPWNIEHLKKYHQ